MFAKALQQLLRSLMLGNRDAGISHVVRGLVDSLPADKMREIWPFPGITDTGEAINHN